MIEKFWQGISAEKESLKEKPTVPDPVVEDNSEEEEDIRVEREEAQDALEQNSLATAADAAPDVEPEGLLPTATEESVLPAVTEEQVGAVAEGAEHAPPEREEDGPDAKRARLD